MYCWRFQLQIDWLVQLVLTFRWNKQRRTIPGNHIRDCYLYKNIEEPTWSRWDDEPSLIDLLFTEEAPQVFELKYLAPLGNSDHCKLSFKYLCYIVQIWINLAAFSFKMPKFAKIILCANFVKFKMKLPKFASQIFCANSSTWENAEIGTDKSLCKFHPHQRMPKTTSVKCGIPPKQAKTRQNNPRTNSERDRITQEQGKTTQEQSRLAF